MLWSDVGVSGGGGCGAVLKKCVGELKGGGFCLRNVWANDDPLPLSLSAQCGIEHSGLDVMTIV